MKTGLPTSSDEKHKVNVHIGKLAANKLGNTDESLELTRMESFLEGSYDIFDVLETHHANRNTPSLYDNLKAEKKNALMANAKQDPFGFNISTLTAFLRKRLSSFMF